MRAAFHGIAIVWREEQNFRLEVWIAVFVLLLAYVFRLNRFETTIILLLIGIVLLLEVINAVVERLVDLAKPRLHHYAESIKDIMAGVVLLGSLLSLIIGMLIFLPYFF